MREAALPNQSSPWIVRTLVDGLYTEPGMSEIANRLAIDIRRGRSFKPDFVPTPISVDDGCKLQSELPEKIAHNVAMRLRDSESKFRGDATKGWDEYVDKYNQMANSYCLSNEQKLQSLQNTLTKDAQRFYAVILATIVAI